MGMTGLCAFGCLQLYFVTWFRRSADATRRKIAEMVPVVPVARIGEDGTSSIVQGVALKKIGSIGSTGKKSKVMDAEKMSLIDGPRY